MDHKPKTRGRVILMTKATGFESECSMLFEDHNLLVFTKEGEIFIERKDDANCTIRITPKFKGKPTLFITSYCGRMTIFTPGEINGLPGFYITAKD